MEKLSMDLPTEIVERAVRDKINAAIAESLGDSEALITSLVDAALKVKVSNTGAISKYPSDNKHSFLDVVTGTFIRKAAEEALSEHLKEMLPSIKEAVIKAVKRSPSKWAELFMSTIEGSMSSSFRPHFTFTLHTKEQ